MPRVVFVFFLNSQKVDLAVFKAFLYRNTILPMQFKIPLVFFYSKCAPVPGLLFLRVLVCLLHHGIGLFSINFFKSKKKRESIVFVTTSRYSEKLRQIRKFIYKTIFSGRSNSSTIFVK